jgi:hypothetical protein
MPSGSSFIRRHMGPMLRPTSFYSEVTRV